MVTADAVIDLFAAAERVLGMTGDAVILCPTYGTHTIKEA